MKKLIRYFRIAMNLNKMTIAEEVSYTFGIKFTGDADATNPIFTDVQLKGLATTVQTELGNRVTDPNPALTAKEQQDVNALTRAIIADKNYVEMVANDKANGDKAIFDEIVKRIGFAPYKDRIFHQRGFEEVESGIGWIHIHVKKEVKGNEGHTWRWAITTARNVPPPAFATGGPELSPIPQVTLESDVVIIGLTSGKYYGIQHYSTLPATQTKKSASKKIISKKKAGDLPVSKAKHPMLIDGAEPKWGEILYVLIP